MKTISKIEDEGLWEDLPSLRVGRCWIFGASDRLSKYESQLDGIMLPFLNQWNAHGLGVEGAAAILYDRFLVIVQGMGGESVSGCSIDSMKNELSRFEKATQVNLLEGSRIYWLSSTGEVVCADREGFKQACRNGEVTGETEVFDTLIDQVALLKPGRFLKPLKESWHARLYAAAQNS